MTQTNKGRVIAAARPANQLAINHLILLLLWISLVLIGQQVWKLTRNFQSEVGASAPTQQSLQVSAGPPSLLLLNAEALAVPSNGGTVKLTARVRDAQGKPVANVAVNFQSAQGTLTPTTAQTDGQGMASATFTAGAAAGQATVTATAGNFTQTATLQIVHPNHTAPRTLTLAPGKTQLPAGQQTTLTIQLHDAAGQPVAGELVTFFGALGAVTPASAVTDANGRVTATFQAGKIVGHGLITALAGSASHSISIQVGGSTVPPPPPLAEADHALYLPLVTR